MFCSCKIHDQAGSQERMYFLIIYYTTLDIIHVFSSVYVYEVKLVVNIIQR
jgi:hypothetical protein